MAITTTDGNQFLRLVPTANGSIAVKELRPWAPRVAAVDFSPDGQLVATRPFRGHEPTIELLRVTDLGGRYVLRGQQGDLGDVRFSPDGAVLASAGDSGVRLWSVSNGALLRLLSPDRASWLAFTPDGKLLVSGSDYWNSDKQVRVYDVSTGENLATNAGHSGGTSAIVVAPDGKVVATAGGNDGGVSILKLPNLSLLRELKPHLGAVSALAFVDQGRMLVVAGFDGSVRLLDVDSGKESCLTKEDRAH
jgi:WD40 repeat protein